MKSLFLGLSLMLLLSLSFAQDNELVDPNPNNPKENGGNDSTDEPLPTFPEQLPIEIILHNLPDFLRVTGSAQGDVANEQVKIGLTIETLKLSAGESLQQNSNDSSRAIAKILLLGLESCDLATSGISIYPSYTSVLNTETNTYTSVFEGYKVRNTITVTTKKIKLAGKIIDAAVSNGVNNVDYISFSPLDSTVQALREQLLAAATNNASKQANIVLNAVGYEVKSVKSLNIVNNNYNPIPLFDFANRPAAADESSTPTFKGSSTVNVQVDVSFIIGKKEE